METKLPPRPSDQQLLTLQRRLKKNLQVGLMGAGVFTTACHRVLRPHLDHPVRVWLDSYAIDLRWWRITFDVAPHSSLHDPLRDYGELTFHRDEVTEEVGEELARFLQEFPHWRWPIFAHDSRYPRYAWTRLGEATYTDDRLLREARQRRIEERRAGR